jgi:hypothetical protein
MIVMVLLVRLAGPVGRLDLLPWSKMIMLKPGLRDVFVAAGRAGRAGCFPPIRDSPLCCA